MRFYLSITGLIILATTSARGDLITNGGFEQPATGTFSTLSSGSTALTGWTISSGTIDVVNQSIFPSYQGSQSLDLDGNVPGAIQQSFGTTVGNTYTLSFAYANNYAGASSSARVSLIGLGVGTEFSQLIFHSGSTIANMNYTLFDASFIANSTTSTLTFASTDLPNDQYGIVLDAVSVNFNAVPEPASLMMTGGAMGVIGLAVRRRRKARAA